MSAQSEHRTPDGVFYRVGPDAQYPKPDKYMMDIPFDEREMLMQAEPDTFHFTAHYKDYPCVLARMASLHPGSFRNFLERRWRKIAPKKLVKERDAALSPPP